MKHLKTYEKYKPNLPKIGNYVIKHIDNPTMLGLKMMSSIGKIIKKTRFGYNISYHIDGKEKISYSTNLEDIIAFGETPEEVKMKAAAKKYNL